MLIQPTCWILAEETVDVATGGVLGGYGAEYKGGECYTTGVVTIVRQSAERWDVQGVEIERRGRGVRTQQVTGQMKKERWLRVLMGLVIK